MTTGGGLDTSTDSTNNRLEDLFMIGQGGMATVHVSRLQGEGGFQKLVAVKRMRSEVAESERARLMFLDEARVAAHIASPHVVSTHDIGRAADGSLYIVMELVLGPTLSQVGAHFQDAGEPPPLDIVAELLAQSADGLHEAHEAITPKGKPLHIVHRDITPRNILLGLDGRVRITDFGIAQARQRLHQTQGSEIKGTFSYMSPEQLRGGDVDRRADIFSLGCVSFELITGHRVFHGDNPLKVMENVLLADIPNPAEIREDMPAPLADAVFKALARDPAERYQTARAYSEALRDAARGALGRPDTQRLREFAQRAGGHSVERINNQLVTALSSSRPPPPANAELEHTVPDVRETMTDQGIPDELRERLERVEAQSKKSGPPWGAIAGGVLVALIGVGAWGWNASQTPDDLDPQAGTENQPTETPTVTTDVAATGQPSNPPPTMNEDTTAEQTGAGGQEADPEERRPPDSVTKQVPRWRNPTMRVIAAMTQSPTTTQGMEDPPAMIEEPVMDTPAAPTMMSQNVGMGMRGGLEGLDAFDAFGMQ